MEFLPYIKGLCWIAIAGGIAFLVYHRAKVKLVTLSEVRNWIESNKDKGTNAYVCRMSSAPMDLRKQFDRETGTQRIINGYKDETSICVVIADANAVPVVSYCFWGTKLDNDMITFLGDKTVINVNLMK